MPGALNGSAEITVVIPTRNRRMWLDRSLGCALGQRGVAVEVIVVDDGSTDGTRAMVGGHPDPRVRVVGHAEPVGVAAARNHGIELACTEWVAVLDDDDLWAPDKLRIQLSAAREHGAGFAYSAAAHVGTDLRVLGIEAAPDPESLAALLRSYNAMPAGSSNVLVTRKLLGELGGFDVSLFHLADWDLWIRLSQRARGVACPDVLVAYVKHPENMLGLRQGGFFNEFRAFAIKHGDRLGDSGREIDRVAVARWVATTHRQAGRRVAAALAYIQAARFGDRRRNLGSLFRTFSERRPYVEQWPPPLSGPEPLWLASLRRQ
jgi:glycosyltransferase involved in cell wall biosynthesis